MARCAHVVGTERFTLLEWWLLTEYSGCYVQRNSVRMTLSWKIFGELMVILPVCLR